MNNLTLEIAESVPWCQAADGKIHVASWTHYGAGCLTTLIEDDDGNTLEMYQTAVSLEGLRHRGTLWRDRRSLDLPICQRCEDDIAEEEDVREALE